MPATFYATAIDAAGVLTEVLRLAWTENTVKGTSVLSLVNGANTITVPTGTTLIVVVPHPTNAAPLKWKGVTGDTGVTMRINEPTAFGWGGDSSFVITATGTPALPVQFTFLGT